MAGLDVKVFSETDGTGPNGLHPSRMCAAKSNKNKKTKRQPGKVLFESNSQSAICVRVYIG
jgi:hypothetical protein